MKTYYSPAGSKIAHKRTKRHKTTTVFIVDHYNTEIFLTSLGYLAHLVSRPNLPLNILAVGSENKLTLGNVTPYGLPTYKL